MEWALDADWHNPDAGWRLFLLLPLGGAEEWYYQLDQNTPPNLESVSPHLTIFPRLLAMMENDLKTLESCVVAVAQSSMFPARAVRPGRYDFAQLKGPFESIQCLENFGTNVKRQALDYLGFLAWWTLSASGWDLYIPQDVVNSILDLNLEDRPKRGVLINLERDWQQISILISFITVSQFSTDGTNHYKIPSAFYPYPLPSCEPLTNSDGEHLTEKYLLRTCQHS